MDSWKNICSYVKFDKFSDDAQFSKVDLMKNTITNEKKIKQRSSPQNNVLSKNEDHILPLKNMSGKTIAIIGNDATESPCIQESYCSCKTFCNEIFWGHMV